MKLNVDYKNSIMTALIVIIAMLLIIILKLYWFHNDSKIEPIKNDTELKYKILRDRLSISLEKNDSLLKEYHKSPAPSQVINIIQKEETKDEKNTVTHLPIDGKVKYLSSWIDSLKRLQ